MSDETPDTVDEFDGVTPDIKRAAEKRADAIRRDRGDDTTEPTVHESPTKKGQTTR